MKLKALFLIAAICAAGTTASAQVHRMCVGVHAEFNPATKAVVSMLFGQLNTTGNRVEEKRVISTAELKTLIPRMQDLGFRSRDVVPPGKVNVTVTDYMNDFKFRLDGKELKIKTRFRKYGTREAGDPNQVFTPIERMLDRSTMEFKIQHPNFDNAVIKRQLSILDSDIKIITSAKKFFRDKSMLRQRLIEMNPNDLVLVESAMQFFTSRYQMGERDGLDMRTIYDRVAYKLDLIRPLDMPVAAREDSQVTFDSNIWFYDHRAQRSFRKYTSDETVVEIKLPPAYLRINRSLVQQIPALQDVSEVRKTTDQKHIEGYVKNKGKSSNAKSVRNKIEDKYEDLIGD